MALKDCIEKLGVVSKEDEARLTEYLAQGMTDEQAVQRLLIETSIDVISIADRVRQEGVELKAPKDALATIADLQDKRLRSLIGRRADLEMKISELNAEYQDLSQNASMLDDLLSDSIGMVMYGPMESLEEGEALMTIGQALFNDRFRSAMERGILGVEGKVPKEIYASWQKQIEARRANRVEHMSVTQKWREVNQRINQIVGESYNQTMLDEPARNRLGLYSALEKAAIDMRLPEWKAGKPASGKAILQKLLKMTGVKKEEVNWTSIEEYLSQKDENGKPAKYTREDVVEYLRENGVQVEETVTDPDKVNQQEDLRFDEGQIWDDDEAWEHQVEDMMYEFDNDYPPSGVEDPSYWFDIDEWFGSREDSIAEDYGFDEEQMERLDGTGNTLAEVAADMGYDIYADYENDVRDAAEEAARTYAYESYMEDPLYIYMAETDQEDIFIFGNADQGYSIRAGDWRNYGNQINQTEIYSLNEAQLQAESYAREQGYLMEEEDIYAPRWGDYVEGVYDNYREIKLKLPDVPGGFVESMHFGDEENIVMFMRVTDRQLFDRADWSRPMGVDRDFNPEDVGLRELTPEEARLNHEQGSTIIMAMPTDSGYNLNPMRTQMTDAVRNMFFNKERATDRGQRYFMPEVAGSRKQTYFIDEAQSDWHQQGREYGYEDSVKDRELAKAVSELHGKRINAIRAVYQDFAEGQANTLALGQRLVEPDDDQLLLAADRVLDGSVDSGTSDFVDHLLAMSLDRVPMSEAYQMYVDASNDLDAALEEQQKRRRAVPDVPFKDDNWLALGLKRAIVQAIEEGADQFAWADADTLINRWGGRFTEMYENQYNKKMPSIVRKATGQKPRHLGPDGGPHRQGETGYWIIDITPELVDKVTNEGFSLFQGRKGSITFQDVPGQEIRQATINLFDAADASTFIHEAGHLYLELMKHLASRPDASEAILRDSETLLKHLGVESFDQIETKHHEHLAESFEKYTIEGKAPSMSLQDAFGSFRTWLLETYRKIRGVRDIELSDEIRGVFDRILATDEEIALAEANMEYAPLYVDAEQAGMTDREFEIYKNGIMRAHNEEVAKQASKLLDAMKRDQKAWWKEELKREEAQVRLQAYQERVFNARSFLMTGKMANGLDGPMAPFKLDRDSVLAVLNGDETTLKKLPHTGSYGIYRRKGGVDVDVAAQALGYTDGLEMIEDLLNAPDMETWIATTAKMVMREKYPDPFKDGSMAGAAIRAVHSTMRANIVAAEMRQLRKQMRETKPVVRATEERIKQQRRDTIAANKGSLPKRDEIQMIRRAAAERIQRETIRNVKPHVYLRAERKAAREAFAAFERGDLEAAYEAKRRQLVNFEMYRAAVKAGDKVQKTRNYLSRFDKRATQEKLGKAGVLNKILGILEGTDLRKRSLAEVDRLEALKGLREDIQGVVDENGNVITPPRFIVRPETLKLILSDMTNWQNLTVEQFDAMKELIQQIEHEADYTQTLYLNDEKLKLDDVIVELEESLANSKEIDLYGGKKSKGERGTDVAKQALTAWLRPGTLARILDKAGWGAVTRRMIVPMRRAYSEKYIPAIHDMQERLSKIYLDHFSLKDMRNLHKRTIKVEGHNKKYSRADALMMALNHGNEGNIKAVQQSLVEGEQIYPQQMIDKLLGTLTEADWKFVQEVWDYLEEFGPDLLDAEERRRGVRPEQVKAKPLTVRTADGKTLQLRGGYFPIVHDSTLSDRVKQDEVEDIATNMGLGVYVSASTRASSTYQRTGKPGLPVRLDLNVIDIHLRDVIRDISIGDEVQSIQKLINDKRFRSAMRKTGNLEALKVLNLWLTDAAVGESPANHISVKMARWVRGGFVKSRLGLSATVSLLQFTGFFQSMATIGTATMARGLGKFMQRPIYWWNNVPKMSAFINARYEIGAWNRDVQDVQSHIDSWFGVVPTIGKRAFNLVGATLFMPIKYAQKVVDITTWLAGYEQARNEKGLSDQESIYFADAMVENAQTSGFFSDRSPLERGTLSENIRQAEYVRIWTTLIGYMLAKGNIAYEKTGQVKWKDPKQVLGWSLDMVLLFTLEGLASAIIYGNWPEDDDDTGEPQYAKWVATSTLDSMVSGVPFVREIPQQRYGSGSTPLGALAKDTLKAYDQAAQGEVDEAFVKSVINLAGYTHVVPSSQLNRTLEAIWDEGETAPLEYITGPRDED